MLAAVIIAYAPTLLVADRPKEVPAILLPFPTAEPTAGARERRRRRPARVPAAPVPDAFVPAAPSPADDDDDDDGGDD